jgi:hypothetical protein
VTSSPPLLLALEDELLGILRPLVSPVGPLTEIVVESISTPDDLKDALERQAARIPVGILSMGGNANWPQNAKPAGLVAQVDRQLTYTFIIAFSDFKDARGRREQLYAADQLFVQAVPDRAFTGLPLLAGWGVDRCEMIASQTIMLEKFYGIVYSFGVRNRAKVYPQTVGVT